MIHISIAEGVAVLSIDMPGRSMNVLTPELADALAEAFEQVIADATVLGIIITSGKSSFIAGADLAQMAPLASAKISEADARAAIAKYGALFRSIEIAGKPVVGAATGTALGGGLELLLATHYRIASDDAASRFGVPEVGLGLLPGAGGTQRLPRLIGLQASLPLLLEGKPIDGAKAEALGLIDQRVPAELLLEQARALLLSGKVAAGARWDEASHQGASDEVAGDALAQVIELERAKVIASTHGNYPAPLAILDAVAAGLNLPMDQALERELDAFMPLLRGHVSKNLIRTLFFARQSADKLARRPAEVARSKISKLALLGEPGVVSALAQLAGSVGISVVQVIAETPKSELADCEMLIELAAEGLASKAEAIALADSLLESTAILVTTTGEQRLSELASASTRPTKLVGLRLLSPTAQSAVVEVVRGEATSAEALARAMDFVKQLRKIPIVVNDVGSSYGQRCVDAYRTEGLSLLAEGIDSARIDQQASVLGMNLRPSAISEPALPENSAQQDAQPAASQVTDAQIRQRLLYAQLLEAACCWIDGVIDQAEDADLAAHLGWGFPAYLGGPFAAIDHIGIAEFVAQLHLLTDDCGQRFSPPEELVALANVNFRFHA